MNATKSLIWFIVAILLVGAGFWGFIHGISLEGWAKVGWMAGSLAELALVVFGAVKLMKAQ